MSRVTKILCVLKLQISQFELTKLECNKVGQIISLVIKRSSLSGAKLLLEVTAYTWRRLVDKVKRHKSKKENTGSGLQKCNLGKNLRPIR